MRATISSVDARPLERIFTIQTSAGPVRGRWMSSPHRTIGEMVDVEIDIGEILEWGRNVVAADEDCDRAVVDVEGNNVLQVRLMGVDRGVCAVGLKEGRFLVEIKELPRELPNFIEIRSSRLSLYEVHY